MQAESVAGVPVLQVGCKALLNKVSISHRVTAINNSQQKVQWLQVCFLPYKDIKQFIFVGVNCIIFPSSELGLAVQPFLDTSSEGEGEEVSNNDEDHSNED